MSLKRSRTLIIFLLLVGGLILEHFFFHNHFFFIALIFVGMISSLLLFNQKKTSEQSQDKTLRQSTAESMIQAIDVPVVIINESAKIIFENVIFSRLFRKKKILDDEVANYFNHIASQYVRIPRFLLVDFRTYRALATDINLDETRSYVITFSDITEYLEGQNMQKRFVADASHELKTPLTSMKLTLELMRGHPAMSETDRLDFIGNLENQTERLMVLVSDLLAMSRLSHQRVPVRVESFSLNKVLSEIVFNHRQAIEDNGLEIILPEQEFFIYSDRLKLTQILENLFANALNYTSEGSIRFIVEETNSTIKIRVADTGLGISSEDLSHVFDRFFRADAARSRYAGGSGLGLSIVKQLTEALGGTVRVTSEINSGTTFTVELPRAMLTER